MKTVKRYGNSGGVYVPRDWVGGKVRLELVEQPPNPMADLAKLPLEHALSIILYGSYARCELQEDSDIDTIIVTDGAKIEIPPGLERYEIQVMTAEEIRKAVNDPVFSKVLRDEAVALVNQSFLDELRKQKPTGSVAKRLELIQSSLSICKEMFSSGEIGIVYPLMLRLKEILFLECILRDKKYSTRMLERTVLGGRISKKEFSLLMKIYRSSRHKSRSTEGRVSRDVVEKLLTLLEKKIDYVRKEAH